MTLHAVPPAAEGTEPVTLSAAEAVVAGLVAAGVTEVFGIAGGKFAPLLEALSRESTLRWTGVRHEAAAAFMATAVAHRTGRLAACIAEMGPGALNLASGLDTARTNHLPVLAITVGTPAALRDPPRGLLMELDAPRLFGAVTKWRATVADARRIPELMARAVRETATGAPGPVHLEVGYDVLGAPQACAAAELEAVTAALHVGRAPADPELVERAAVLLSAAERPLLIAGGGVIGAEAAGELRAVAARLGAPVLVTQMGIGALASDDAHLVGQGGVVFGESVLRALREADVVLAAGVSLLVMAVGRHGARRRRQSPPAPHPPRPRSHGDRASAPGRGRPGRRRARHPLPARREPRLRCGRRRSRVAGRAAGRAPRPPVNARRAR